jgi:DNA-binding PadR family transcriptional regulator
VILLSLAEREKHGYQIMKDVCRPQGGMLNLVPGTLDGSMERMLRDGLVVESGLSDNERRRYYRLTERGRTVLAAELDRLETAITAARALESVTRAGATEPT